VRGFGDDLIAGSTSGYLNNGPPESDVARLAGLRRGLNRSGDVAGRNLVIDIAGRVTKLTNRRRWRLSWSSFEWP
jgi:hypothetical protein